MTAEKKHVETTTARKAIVITDSIDGMESVLPDITRRTLENLVVFSTIGAVISQPFDSLIKNILVTVYSEDIEEIYVVVGKSSVGPKPLSKEDWLLKMEKAGVSRKVVDTLQYLRVVEGDLFEWLNGPHAPEDVLASNVKRIQNHPLLPKAVTVRGILLD